MKELKTGVMVFVALAMFMMAVLTLGDLGNRVSYVIPFPKVVGLTVDSPVQLNGVQVGRVERIRFAKKVEDHRIFVTVNLEADVGNRINSSTVADINSLGMLGDKYIALSTRDYTLPPLPEGGTIKTKPALNVEAMLEHGRTILEDMTSLVHTINQLVESVKSGEGLVGMLINDPQLGQDILDSMSVISANLSEGEGLLGKLINDPDFGQTVSSSVERTALNLDRIVAAAASGDSAAHALLMDPDFGKQFEQDARAAMEGLRILGERLAGTTEGSLLVTALQDDQLGEDLKVSISHLRSILEKIDNGEGTLGRLVNDASLYENADTVLTGAKKSKITRAVVKHYRKKGESEKQSSESE